jgi:hypothetical protein
MIRILNAFDKLLPTGSYQQHPTQKAFARDFVTPLSPAS